MMRTILTILLIFWNLENFFAPGQIPDKRWTAGQFYSKCNGVAKVMLMTDDRYGAPPDIAAFAEIGDSSVIRRLVYATPLRKLGYGIVHYESPDRRGIDCALLYRRSRLRLLSSKPCHLYDSTGAVMPTRDILLAVFAPLEETASATPGCFAVLVNHHPSKVGSDSESRRSVAMERMHAIADSLRREGIGRIVAVGDFNEEVAEDEDVTLAQDRSMNAPGTIKFEGRWEKIDACPLLEGFTATETIFAPSQLLTRDSAFSGMKPLRTFSGPRYAGGLSDHLPILLELEPKP